MRFRAARCTSSFSGCSVEFPITPVLAFVGGAPMSGGLLRRIETISRAARDIMAGDFSRRIPVRGTGDESREIASIG
jgi:HAMP domain-containing protein